MHALDLDIEGKNSQPWQTELVYTAYFALVSAGVLILARAAPNQAIMLAWLNLQLILLLSYADALKTRVNIVLAILLAAGMYGWFLGRFNIALLILTVLYTGALMIERKYFFPFDKHPVVILVGKAVLGVFTWLILQASMGLSWHVTLEMYFVTLVVTVIAYGYMVVLRIEHINQIQNARHVHFDDLTHARNWLSFRNDLDVEFEQKIDLGVIAMDVDNFKQINDQFGHLAGNATLIYLVDQIQAHLANWTSGAHLYRTGGEEFTILFPHTTSGMTQQLAKDIQEIIRRLLIPIGDGHKISITVSIGVSTAHQTDVDAMSLFKRTDHLLYQSKYNGRDQLTSDIEE